ncbi:hypothetical protein GEMRC1_006393 [Eukaryota sp. GEM-RC1]
MLNAPNAESPQTTESRRGFVALQLLLFFIGGLGCLLSWMALYFPLKMLNFSGFWMLTLFFLLLKPHHFEIDRRLFGRDAPEKPASFTAFGLIVLSIPFYLVMFSHFHLYLITLPPSLALFQTSLPDDLNGLYCLSNDQSLELFFGAIVDAVLIASCTDGFCIANSSVHCCFWINWSVNTLGNINELL